jgi:glycine/D-amino acid oxidase-like deaminating enzyme
MAPTKPAVGGIRIMPTRRETIIQLGAAGTALLMPRDGFSSEDNGFQLAEWTGDSFAPMHAIRDGQWSQALPSPERQVDVAVVGGGLAGLAVATMLDDLDLLLLEREAEPGGNAKAGNWRGIDYALGSAYFVDISEPYGSFYARLGLAPPRVREPADRVLTGAPGSPDALEGALRRPFAELRRHLGTIAASPDFPKIPIDKATPAALALDRISFLDYLKQAHIDPSLFGLIDAYCYSSLGASAKQVSAYAGINFYSEIAGPIYAFPGGNAVMARAMARHVERAGAGRILTGAAVFAIEPVEGGLARVGWFDAARPGEPRCIAARWVVVAAPFFFAARILRGLDPGIATKMKARRQGSYLVANCCFEGLAATSAYDHWTPGNLTFTDVVDATATLPAAARPATHSVLTVYAPFRDPDRGRELLLAGDRASLSAPIAAGLRRFLPDALAGTRLSEVKLTRWGHQHLIPRPGTVSLMRALPKRFGNALLAHSDGQALPAAESAIFEGLRAAAVIRGG